MDCSPPDSSVHRTAQARMLEWVAISFSRGSSQPKDQTHVSCTAGRFFPVWATRKSACYLNKTLPLWWTGYRTPRPSVTSYNCTSVYFTSKILVLFFFFLIDVTLKCLESCNLLKLLGTSEEAVPSLSSLSAPTQDIVIQTTCFSCVQTRDLGVWRPEPSLQQRRLSSGFVGRLTVPKKSNHSTFHLLKTCMYHRV